MRILAKLWPQVLVCFLMWGSAIPLLRAQETESGFAKGVVMIRSRVGESDEFANAVLFKRMESFAVVTKFFTNGPNALVIENVNIAGVLTFDEIFTRDLIDGTDKALVAQKKAGLAAMIKQFPKAAPLLKQVMDNVITYEKNLNSDQVRFRGGWTSRGTYNAMLKSEEAGRLAERQRMEAEQRAKEETALAMKLADIKARESEAKRKREEESARMEEERRKTVMAASQAAEEERRKAGEAADVAKRQSNLKSRPAGLAAQYLLASFAQFAKDMSDLAEAGKQVGRMTPPDSWNLASALSLPRILGHETSLLSGGSGTAPSSMYVHDEGHIIAVRMAVPLKSEEGKLENVFDLRELNRVLSSLDPAVAQWLPFGLASVRTKSSLHHLDEDGNATVVREIEGRVCELSLSAPTLDDDGGFYSYLAVTLR